MDIDDEHDELLLDTPLINRKGTQPDTVERGSATASGSGYEKKFAALHKEAERTGDRTAYIRFRKQLKDQGIDPNKYDPYYRK